jgi:hypothetical protein
VLALLLGLICCSIIVLASIIYNSTYTIAFIDCVRGNALTITNCSLIFSALLRRLILPHWLQSGGQLRRMRSQCFAHGCIKNSTFLVFTRRFDDESSTTT